MSRVALKEVAEIVRHAARRSQEARYEQLLLSYGFEFVNTEHYWRKPGTNLLVILRGDQWIASHRRDELHKPKFSGTSFRELQTMLESVCV